MNSVSAYGFQFWSLEQMNDQEVSRGSSRA